MEPLKLTLKHPLPSWNAICGLGHWQRAKLKEAIQLDFLSALQASAGDSWTKITSAKNMCSIAAATLVSYREMRQEQRALRRAKKKSEAKPTSGRKLRFSR